MKHRQYAFLLATLFLTACASIGLQTPQTFTERALYVQNNITGWVDAATNALNLGAISSDDAVHARAVAVDAQTALNAARAAFDVGDMGTAEGKLQLASAALHQLELYLIQRNVKKES